MPYDVDIGDGADALGQNQLSDALDGTYWVSGWDATLGTGDLEVDIAAGSGAVDGTDVSTGSTQTIDFTGDPDSTDPRKAVIYVDSGGTVQKALGTPQPVDPTGEIRFRTYNPSPPASVSGVVVAEVWLAAAETVLETADVRDRRVANQAAANATPNVPNWVEDPNSPLNISNSTSGTITLSNTYDSVKVVIFTITGRFDMTVNNVTSDYRTISLDGSFSTNAQITNAVEYPGQNLVMGGDWSGGGSWGVDLGQLAASTGRPQTVTNFTVSTPLDTITFLSNDGTQQSLTAKVYGLNE